MSARNHCILAHGYDTIKDETFLDFAREIEGILKMFFDAEKLDYEAEKIKARHMPLDTEMLNRFIFGWSLEFRVVFISYIKIDSF